MPDPKNVEEVEDKGVFVEAVEAALKQTAWQMPPFAGALLLSIATMVQDFYDDARSYLFMKKIESLAATAHHFDEMDEGHFRELFIDEVRTRLAEAGVDIEAAKLTITSKQGEET